MPEEIGFVLDNLKFVKISVFGDLKLYSGEWLIKENLKIYITVGWSGWGKVSAARATTRLLATTYNNYPIDFIFFTGVAGAVNKKLNQWDVVIAESLIHHDMDARPIFGKYIIPSLNKDKIFANNNILEKVFSSLKEKFMQQKDKTFGTLHKGLIGTGDMFISDRKKIEVLLKEIPGLLAIEMEGAAFAQVCHQENIDWIVLRVISDDAKENADQEFNEFLEKYKLKSLDLIKNFLISLFEK